MFVPFARLTRRAVLAGLAVTLLAPASLAMLAGHDVAAKGAHAHHGVSQEGKRQRSRTVTRTFRNDDGILIPEGEPPAGGLRADPYPSTIRVAGFKRGRIVDLDLTLDHFQHGTPPDVQILLVKEGANGQAVQVVGNVGDVSADDVPFITLDDEADQPLPFFEHLTAGRFRPTVYDPKGIDGENFPAPAPPLGDETTLSAFDGLNPNGTWRLYVADARNVDGGSIDGWELTLQAQTHAKRKR